MRNTTEYLKQHQGTSDRIMSIREASVVLNCCARTVHRLINDGLLKRAIFPGRVRGKGIYASEVESLLQKA